MLWSLRSSRLIPQLRAYGLAQLVQHWLARCDGLVHHLSKAAFVALRCRSSLRLRMSPLLLLCTVSLRRRGALVLVWWDIRPRCGHAVVLRHAVRGNSNSALACRCMCSAHKQSNAMQGCTPARAQPQRIRSAWHGSEEIRISIQ